MYMYAEVYNIMLLIYNNTRDRGPGLAERSYTKY
jgi:hypothetical protein